MYTGKRRGFTPQTLREHKRKLKEGAKKLFTSRSSHKIEQSGEDESLYAMGSESHGKDWKLVDDKKGDGDGEDDDLTFTSFQWANWRAQGFRSLEKYKVDDVGRMEDLVVTKDRRDIRLQVECLRPATSVATTVCWMGGVGGRSMMIMIRGWFGCFGGRARVVEVLDKWGCRDGDRLDVFCDGFDECGTVRLSRATWLFSRSMPSRSQLSRR